MEVRETACGDFLDALAAKTSTPGGGGASALAGAVGTALCTMVGQFTLGKKKYAAAEPEVRALMDRAEDLRRRLLALADADAAAFAPLSAAYALPKDSPERSAVMERCLRDAAAVPLEILRLSGEALELHREMLDKGSTLLVSDVGTGAALCWGALQGAALNVKVNTRSMAERDYAAALDGETEALLARYRLLAEEIYQTVLRRCS